MSRLLRPCHDASRSNKCNCTCDGLQTWEVAVGDFLDLVMFCHFRHQLGTQGRNKGSEVAQGKPMTEGTSQNREVQCLVEGATEAVAFNITVVASTPALPASNTCSGPFVGKALARYSSLSPVCVFGRALFPV